LLLDTHTFVWAAVKPSELSARARSLLTDPAQPRFVSAVTAYEIAQLGRRGRLLNASVIVDGWDAQVAALGAHAIAITVIHATLAGSLPHPHGDPWDRVIAAQAIVEGMAVLTRDLKVRELGATTTW
jgi:PIN domain nuclease of toxin-antitoxin system